MVHLQGKTRGQVRVRGRIEYTRSYFAYFRKNRPASSPVLRLLFPLKSLLEFLVQTPAVFLPKVRRRWVETASVLGWQLFWTLGGAYSESAAKRIPAASPFQVNS